jgi:BlaI family transcriptional regulator, penicillinase repressor
MNLSKSEQQVLEVLWSEQPLTVGQVIERLRARSDWHENTIKTLLTRLLDKKAVARRKDGGRFFYRSLVTRDDILMKESQGLLNRFFDGQMAPLVAHFADKLSKRDIEGIEKILAELKDRDA